MAIEKINLNKLIKLFYLPDNKLITELRGDIRTERNKRNGTSSGGGNFYLPFWSDARKHVLGECDISEETIKRIKKAPGRRALYTKLENGFNELSKRLDNRNIEILKENAKGSLKIDEFGLEIKVENIISISVDGEKRYIYPYWFPEPELNDRALRQAFWVINNALKSVAIENVRIFDLCRGNYYSIANCNYKGNEVQMLKDNYTRIISLRDKLLRQY